MIAQPVQRSEEPACNPAPSAEAGCAIVIEEHGLRIPASALTLSGFRAWAKSDDFPERGRISFIDPEIFVDMSPEELQTHGKVKLAITLVLGSLVQKRDLGEFYPDRTLVTNEAAGLSIEPDATFASWKTLESGRLRLIPREEEPEQFLEVEGTPDCVVEIVSNTSVRKDTRRLRETYHRAGIPEYWLIDARGLQIDFQILQQTPDGYVAAPGRGGWQRSAVFGRRFRFQRERGRLGLWLYTLQSRTAR
jgi:Uma2 family endonuclease